MRLPTSNDNIVLRSLKADDAVSLHSWTDNPEIAKFFVFTRVPSSLEKSRRFLESQLNGDANNIHLAIEEIGTGDFVGLVSLKNINWIDRNAEFAIVIVSEDKTGKGYGRAATVSVIEYAFITLNLHRIYLSVLSSNIRAKTLYEKVGFKQEGVWREHAFMMGKYQDLLWYGLTRDMLKT